MAWCFTEFQVVFFIIFLYNLPKWIGRPVSTGACPYIKWLKRCSNLLYTWEGYYQDTENLYWIGVVGQLQWAALTGNRGRRLELCDNYFLPQSFSFVWQTNSRITVLSWSRQLLLLKYTAGTGASSVIDLVKVSFFANKYGTSHSQVNIEIHFDGLMQEKKTQCVILQATSTTNAYKSLVLCLYITSGNEQNFRFCELFVSDQFNP